MGSRAELQTLLKSLLESDNVYFQPPPTVKMQYDCIIYKKDDVNTFFADNKPYANKKRYQVIVVTTDPDSDIPDKIGALPLCSFDRFYTADNLNHNVYNLFF